MNTLRYDQINPYPLECHQGEDKAFVMFLKKRDGTVYDLTDATIKGQARSADNIKRFDLAIKIANASAGQIILTVAPGQTEYYGKYYYDLQVTKNNKIDYLQPSSFTILQTITTSFAISDSDKDKDDGFDSSSNIDELSYEFIQVQPPGNISRQYQLDIEFTKIISIEFTDLNLKNNNLISIDLMPDKNIDVRTSVPIAETSEAIIIGFHKSNG